jgi:ubiquinone/menaquinone biosynthesis C-methylase UbiE
LVDGGESLPLRGAAAGLEWFLEKYNRAVDEIVAFCADCAVPLEGIDVADVGCGEGSMALGFLNRVHPRRVVGFDTVATDTGELLDRARTLGLVQTLPSALEFRRSQPTQLPAEAGEFDFVYSWSAFEHIADPVLVLREIHRILRPNGCFFLTLWPFYFSPKGSHLWQWFDQDFHHLLDQERDIVAQVAASDRQPREWAEHMTHEFERLNRITTDELQRAVLAAGFDVARVDLETSPVLAPSSLSRYSWADLAISGIKLLARPRR